MTTKRRTVLAAALFLLFTIATARGEGRSPQTIVPPTKTWTGLAGIGNWSAAFNWNPGGAPVGGEALIFPSSAPNKTSFYDLPSMAFDSITFLGSGYTVTNFVPTITLTNGIVDANAGTAGTNTINPKLRLAASQAWSTGSGDLMALYGTVDLQGFTLTLTSSSSGSWFVGGEISGPGAIVKGGSGLVHFDAANSYSGATTITAGTLSFNHDYGLGLESSGTEIQDGSIVAISGGITVNEPLYLMMTGDKTIASGASNNIVTGPIVINGTLHVSVPGSFVLDLRGQMSGSGGLSIDSPGGAAGIVKIFAVKTYSGLTAVNAGTLWLDQGTVSGPVTLAQGATLAATGGHVGSLTVNGSLSPGAPLTNGSSVISAADATFSAASSFLLDINGATFPNYDELQVTGDVALAGNLNVNLGYTPAIGDSFNIVLSSMGTINGTFNGLPDGATLTSGSWTLGVHYESNRVTLTVLCPAGDATAPTVAAPSPITLTQTTCS